MPGRSDAQLFPVLLVRHGESEWNVARLTQGQTMHPALTERGRAQARSAGVTVRQVLADCPAPAVWTSDLVRAQQTAELLVAQLGADVPAVIRLDDKRLREQHLGDLEGRSYEETWAAGEAHDWSDPALPVSGGESVLQVHQRIAEVLADAFEAAVVRPVVLVSHGDAIRVALARLSGFGPGQGEWVEVPNGAVFAATPDGFSVSS